MTIIQKLQATFLDWRSALFGKPKDHGDPKDWTWVNDDFYTEGRRKWEKIESLKRWIDASAKLADRKQSQRKAHLPIRAQIKRVEQEIRDIENGRMVYDPAFGAWVVKGEK